MGDILINKNFRFFRFIKGYTLIELVVVMGILSMTIGAITVFLVSVLKGTSQANISAEVKQNGQAVLDSLERQIRGAVDVVLVGTNMDQIKLTRDFSEPLHIKCELASGSGPTARNSRISIQVAEQPTSGSWISVSNDDPKTGISIEACRLDVLGSQVTDSGVSVPAVVSISFVAKKESPRPEFSASAKFKTTISLRRY